MPMPSPEFPAAVCADLERANVHDEETPLDPDPMIPSTYLNSTRAEVQAVQACFPRAVLSPPALTETVNDYAPEGLAAAGLLRLAMIGEYQITGILAPVGAFADGRELRLVNVGDDLITLPNESAGSAEANRFLLGTGNIELGVNEGCTLVYDATSARWRCVGKHT